MSHRIDDTEIGNARNAMPAVPGIVMSAMPPVVNGYRYGEFKFRLCVVYQVINNKMNLVNERICLKLKK